MTGVNGTARRAAVAAWHQSAAAGKPLTGTQLAERFGRSPSWGRTVVRQAREVAAAAGAPAPTAAAESVAVAAASLAVRRVTVLAVLAVALVAAVASYDHQRLLADLAGEGWRAWLLPLSVDGLVVSASMTMLARRRAGLGAGFLTWLALFLGLGASLAANVAAAQPTLAGRLVAAWPPVALAVSYELAMRQTRPA